MNIGARYLGGRKCRFRVWAPFLKDLTLTFIESPQRHLPMKSLRNGYWEAVVSDVSPGTLYVYHSKVFGDKPDPASLSQPQGVHGPSQVVDHRAYSWRDKTRKAVKLEEMIIYELHVGTFTPDGTFTAAIGKLDYLKDLGINAVEIMPVAQFPGQRNWGYDGVYPFAVQNSYGRIDDFKRLIDECHLRHLSVVLDVVYNHLGPEGNYLNLYGPYFTDKYKTPWGWAVNFDDRFSDDVRNYFIQNALYWFRDFHVDALRLDAVHAIYDFSAKPFLKELAEKTQEYSVFSQRKHFLIAESDLNDASVVNPIPRGGLGIDAQWSDDFHHAVHSVMTKESFGYYRDFGEFEKILKALKTTFVYDGQYSDFRKHHHGNSAAECPAKQFVVSLQNHDQVGNRMNGDRLSQLVSSEALKAAAGLMMFSPYIPLLFMGEEYGEKNPFLYFVDHGDPQLIQAVRNGRQQEFSAFHWKGEPPDPQSPETFSRSKLDWNKLAQTRHFAMWQFYRALIKLRKESSVLKNSDKKNMELLYNSKGKIIVIHRWRQNQHLLAIMNLGARQQSCRLPLPAGTWQKVLDSTDVPRSGQKTDFPFKITTQKILSIKPWSFAAYRREKK